ncbi:hypothetical protein [Pseudomonas chlororaphis]|uniref:hypothetical protein n=1 Tax=Pseudomonas chlororaphis TaxID=587753 RepID=UPI001929620D|nr:hypothetical protein [Pseudomonas chlororaphis]QQX61656.1 hypothetical protein JHW28_14235 [Pseudomonas chlororaphis subsp. aurantiaca]
MKASTLLLAGLMIASSGAAFAEGGAERMKHYWDNFPISQQIPRTDSEQTSSESAKNPQAPAADQTRATAQPDA